MAEKKDIKFILDLLVQVNMVHHIGRPDLFNGPATKYTEEELEGMFGDARNPIFVYEENEKVLGYAFCQTVEHPDDNILTDISSLYIDDLCVDENERGKHIGKKLLQHVKDYAKENGYYNVTLNVWELNKSAYSFYINNGFGIQKTVMEMIL